MIIYLDSIFIQFFELQKIYSWSIRKMEKRWEIFVLWFMSWPVGEARDFPVLLVSTLRGSGVSPVSHSWAISRRVILASTASHSSCYLLVITRRPLWLASSQFSSCATLFLCASAPGRSLPDRPSVAILFPALVLLAFLTCKLLSESITLLTCMPSCPSCLY